jgi:hypothetical protein
MHRRRKIHFLPEISILNNSAHILTRDCFRFFPLFSTSSSCPGRKQQASRHVRTQMIDWANLELIGLTLVLEHKKNRIF